VRITAAIVGLLAAILLLGGEANARRGVPVENYDNVVVARADRKVLSADKVREAIVRAATQLRWIVLEDSPGTIVTNLSIRGKHSMTVQIRYTGQNFSIAYRDSSNLNYGKGEHGTDIHPTYNKEVKKLLDSINAALQQV
jgi:hypothetical protein